MGETDPHVADTDNDGFDDGTEVTLGTDPLNAQSFPAPAAPALPLGDLLALVGALCLTGSPRAARRG